ncbi:MAG: WD40/YVTN/BNR-like repeat-containing protein [Candidatus Kapaibacterium sp.]
MAPVLLPIRSAFNLLSTTDMNLHHNVWCAVPARVFSIVLATVFMSFCTDLHAQNLNWKHAQGLDGGTVGAMLHLPSGDVLAGTETGLFVSSNAGATWSLRGIRSATVNGLASVGDTIYAAIGYAAEDGSGGVFRSVDNGITWQKNLTTEYLWCVAAATNVIVAGSDGNGVFVTTNGAEWTNGLAGKSVYAVAIRGTSLYAGTDADGVFVSVDNGKTWTSSGLSNRGSVYGLAANASTIAACGDFGVAVSRNGSTWLPAGQQGQSVWCVALRGDTLFAGTDTSGVEVRVANGPWVASNLADESVFSLSVSGAEVMAGTWLDGVFRSTDAGETFSDRSTNLTAVPIRCFLPSSSASEPSFAAGSGIAISENGGSVWQWLPFYGEVYAMIKDNGSVIAATDDGLYVSRDGGLEWNGGPLAGDTVYSVLRAGANLVAGCASKGIQLSTDNGSTWRASSVQSGSVSSMTMMGNSVIAVTEEGEILQSTDNAASFTLLYENVEHWYTSVAVVDGAIVVGLAGQDVLISPDSGRTWQQRLMHSVLLSDVTAVTASQSGMRRQGATHSSVFAAAYGAGIFESTNGGFTWTEEVRGLQSKYALGVAENSGVVMAGIEGEGVVYSPVLVTSVEDYLYADGTSLAGSSSDGTSFGNISVRTQPAQEFMTIQLPPRYASMTVELTMCTVQGAVACRALAQSDERGAIQTDVQSLPSGVYAVRVQAGQLYGNATVVVLH